MKTPRAFSGDRHATPAILISEAEWTGKAWDDACLSKLQGRVMTLASTVNQASYPIGLYTLVPSIRNLASSLQKEKAARAADAATK